MDSQRTDPDPEAALSDSLDGSKFILIGQLRAVRLKNADLERRVKTLENAVGVNRVTLRREKKRKNRLTKGERSRNDLGTGVEQSGSSAGS